MAERRNKSPNGKAVGVLIEESSTVTSEEKEAAMTAIVKRLVGDPAMILFDALTQCETGVDESLGESLMILYRVNHQLPELLSTLIKREVSATRTQTTIFRGTTYPTCILGAYMRQRTASYLNQTIGPFLAELVTAKEGLEDPSRILDEATRDVMYGRLQKAVAAILNLIYGSVPSFPDTVREVLHLLKQEVSKQFPSSNPLQVVGSFLFLRIFCPSIVDPVKAGILDSLPNHKTHSLPMTLVVLSKALQCVANGSSFGNPEDEKNKVFNEFIQTHTGAMELFCEEISGDKPLGKHELTDGSATQRGVVKRKNDKIYNKALLNVLIYFKSHETDLGPIVTRLDPPTADSWALDRRKSIPKLLPPLKIGQDCNDGQLESGYPPKYHDMLLELAKISQTALELELADGDSASRRSSKRVRATSLSNSRKGLKRVLSGKFNKIETEATAAAAAALPPHRAPEHLDLAGESEEIPLAALPVKRRSRSTTDTGGVEAAKALVRSQSPPPRALSSQRQKKDPRSAYSGSGASIASASWSQMPHSPPQSTPKRRQRTTRKKTKADEQNVMISVVTENLKLKEEIEKLKSKVNALSALKQAYTELVAANEQLQERNALLEAQALAMEINSPK